MFRFVICLARRHPIFKRVCKNKKIIPSRTMTSSVIPILRPMTDRSYIPLGPPIIHHIPWIAKGFCFYIPIFTHKFHTQKFQTHTNFTHTNFTHKFHTYTQIYTYHFITHTHTNFSHSNFGFAAFILVSESYIMLPRHA